MFGHRSSYSDRGNDTNTQPQKQQALIYKYYMEVVGASKELYTVKANRLSTENGYYAFILDNEMIATYPINRTIIKSIELKSE